MQMEIAIVPRWIIGRLRLDEDSRIHLNILLSSLAVVALLVLMSRSRDLGASVPHYCLFERLLGIPCPGCGLVRSALALTRGEITRSWHLHPAGAFVLLFLVLQIPLRGTALLRPDAARAAGRFSRKVSSALVLGIVAGWLLRIS
jgi:hypothetical protein